MRLTRVWCKVGCAIALVSAMGIATTSVQADDAPSVGDFMRPVAWSQVTLSPSGRYIAAFVPDPNDSNRRVLAVLDSASGRTVHIMTPPAPAVIAHYAWAGHDRLVMSPAIVPEDGDAFPTGTLIIADPDGSHLITQYGLGAITSPIDGAHHRGLAILVDSAPMDQEAILVSVSKPGSRGREAEIERVDVRTGAAHGLGTSPAPGARLIADHAGRVRAAYADQTATGSRLWLRADDQSPWILTNDPVKTHISIVPIGFARDDGHLYVRVSQRGGLHRIERMDVATLERKLIYQGAFADPGELRPTFDGKDYFAVLTHDGVTALHYLGGAEREASIHRSLSESFPNQLVDFVSVSDDGNHAILRASSDRNPGDYYWVDLGRQHLRHLFGAAQWLPPDAMRPMEPIELKSRDGLTLHGFLTRPAGNGPSPMVVLPHGGPVGIVDRWTFNPEVQMLATHGFAVLQVNYRGSSGYGASFQALGDRQWGLGMQDDLTDATQWAIKVGYAAKGRICIYGASYGGYAALEGAVREPDLYRCAIGFAGIYDLRVQRDASDTRRSALGQAYLSRALGNDTNDLLRRSPLSGVDRIKADILLLHGKKDMRVPYENFEAFVAALKAQGKPVETVIEPTEGHGFTQLEHRVAAYTTILDFLQRNLFTPPRPPAL